MILWRRFRPERHWLLFPALVLLFIALVGGARAGGLPLELNGARSILVVSPHPDDETLCCGGLLHHAATSGISVFVVWITGGDASTLAAMARFGRLSPNADTYRELGELRFREAARAADRLGIPQGHTFFLGFPDQGLENVYASCLENYTSSATAWNAAHYQGSYRRGAGYDACTLREILANIIEKTQPDIILAPSLLDVHPDHRAAGYFSLQAASLAGFHGRFCRWVVHSYTGWFDRAGLLDSGGIAGGLKEFHLNSADLRAKAEALGAYESQWLFRDYLLAKLGIANIEYFDCLR